MAIAIGGVAAGLGMAIAAHGMAGVFMMAVGIGLTGLVIIGLLKLAMEAGVIAA